VVTLRSFMVPVAVTPPDPTGGPTPVRTGIDLSPLGPLLAADSAAAGFRRLVLGAQWTDADRSPHEVAVQFRPQDGDPHALGGEIAWLAEPEVRDIQVRVDVEEVVHSESVARLPRIATSAFPNHQVIPGYSHTAGIEVDGEEVIGYCHDPSIPKPFYYPVRGPSGRHLTRRHHARDLDGRSHEHHRSLWFEHMDVNGTCFETEDLDLLHAFGGGGELMHGVGRIRQRRFLAQEDGAVFARMVSDLEWLDGNGDPLLEQVTDLRVYGLPDHDRLLDVELAFRPLVERVTFGQTSFGGLAVRLAAALEAGNGRGRIENDSGARNEAGCHWQRSRWLDASGPVALDEWNGIAILDHPANPGYPTGWHVRDDGWFCAAPSFLAPLTIERGGTLRLAHRVVLHRGDAHAGRVDARQRAFAEPPAVAVGAITPRPSGS